MATPILEKLIRKEDLSADEARSLMSDIMSGRLDEARMAAILTALRMKGETVEEIAGFASVMRANAVHIQPARRGLIDTCGTGGDARHTFNISTAAALVSAAMGIPVAKHGNRAVSSRCGSADVLEALGVNIQLTADGASRLIDRVGIGFLFAPQHPPAMRHAAPVRRQMGVRTVFNLLGPLTNPAGVKRQLIGVFDGALTEVVCRVLETLGSEKAFVVHGLDGTDEVSLSGATRVSVLDGGRVRTFQFTPEEAGIARSDVSDIGGGSPEENASHVRDILNGDGGARRDAVLLNAGFAALLGDRAATVREGVRVAKRAIDSGRARELLEDLCRVSHSIAREAA